MSAYKLAIDEGMTKNVVNHLLPLKYYKDNQLLEVHFADIDLAHEDKLNPISGSIGVDVGQVIEDTNRFSATYEDKRLIDVDEIVQQARDGGYKYIVVLSGEGDCFINH